MYDYNTILILNKIYKISEIIHVMNICKHTKISIFYLEESLKI